VELYSVESVADSSADKSTEVSRESLLTDPTWSVPEPMIYKAQPLESKILHQHNYQLHHRHYQSNQPTMSFTASSPARVSVTLNVVDDRSMCSMSPALAATFMYESLDISTDPSCINPGILHRVWNGLLYYSLR